jgi:arginine decarboxylase
MRYVDWLQQHQAADGRLNDFLSVYDGRILLGDEVDLLALAEQHGTPLEIAYCPQIAYRIAAMRAAFRQGAAASGYRGGFRYAYASKANVVAEVVTTALSTGADYELSSNYDVIIARQLWQRGQISANQWVYANGSKSDGYLQRLIDLRMAGMEQIIPVIDDPTEFEVLSHCQLPFRFGIRLRSATGGGGRFGVSDETALDLTKAIAASHHQLVMLHSMVGSQIEDHDNLIDGLERALPVYAAARTITPELTVLNFGGGFPTTAYQLHDQFDYAERARQIQAEVGAWCDANGVPHPELAGEFGRYTVADYGALIFRVGRVKPATDNLPWYLVDGSLMVAMPDLLIVPGQEFITLALNHWEQPAQPVRLGGRATCDSDDYYPKQGELWLPTAGTGLLVAFFGTGAYQSMLSGEGGAHHCLTPEARKIILRHQDGKLHTTIIPEQSDSDVLAELGYRF